MSFFFKKQFKDKIYFNGKDMPKSDSGEVASDQPVQPKTFEEILLELQATIVATQVKVDKMQATIDGSLENRAARSLERTVGATVALKNSTVQGAQAGWSSLAETTKVLGQRAVDARANFVQMQLTTGSVSGDLKEVGKVAMGGATAAGEYMLNRADQAIESTMDAAAYVSEKAGEARDEFVQQGTRAFNDAKDGAQVLGQRAVDARANFVQMQLTTGSVSGDLKEVGKVAMGGTLATGRFVAQKAGQVADAVFLKPASFVNDKVSQAGEALSRAAGDAESKIDDANLRIEVLDTFADQYSQKSALEIKKNIMTTSLNEVALPDNIKLNILNTMKAIFRVQIAAGAKTLPDFGKITNINDLRAEFDKDGNIDDDEQNILDLVSNLMLKDVATTKLRKREKVSAAAGQIIFKSAAINTEKDRLIQGGVKNVAQAGVNTANVLNMDVKDVGRAIGGAASKVFNLFGGKKPKSEPKNNSNEV